MTTKTLQRGRRGRPSRDAVFARFAAAIGELANYGGLPKPYEAKKLWDDLWALEAHHSTAIEGNTLVLRQVEKLLHEGRAVGSKEIREYMEVLGYADAATWVYKQAVAPDEWEHDGLVSLTEVRRIHTLAMKKVWEVAPHPDAYDTEEPGSFRHHEIMPFSGGMQPPTFPLVPAEISAWVDEANALGQRLRHAEMPVSEVPEALARLHRRFEWIHPFIDGNGRTGRLVLNLLLVRLGWPPAIILKEQRKRYLSSLDRADNGDFGPLAEIIARCVVDSLHRLIPNIAGPVKYVPLESLADGELSIAALRQAATRGRLDAVLGADGHYRSSRAAVDEYKQSRQHTGGKAHMA
ncbi:MAG: Fic family protein [Cellulomonadaceae bacterium]|jgi:Fic family protein|nr:Fic family protein [Cellulomonadaceae bacterium]